MGITFKGHDNDWQYWVFDIDGRDWVAVNQSTPEPLKIQFQGRYRNWGNIPLSKAGGFDIVASTSRGADKDGQNQGTVEWTWNGARYKSSWTLIAGNEIVAGDPEEGIEPIWDYQLGFVGRIPYEGPTGGAVGTGVTSQAVIEAAKNKEDRELAEATRQIVPSAQLSTAAPEQQYPLPMSVASRPVTAGIATPTAIQAAQSGSLAGQSGEAIQETRDAIALAFKALSVSKSGGTVNVNAFNNARTELKNAKDALAVAESRGTPGEQVLLSQLREQVDTIQGEVDIQLRYLQTAQTTQTPSGSYGGPSGSGYTEPPPTKPVTSGIVSKTVIDAQNGALAGQSGEAIQETRDAIALAFKALSVSKSGGTVNVNAFNNARTELKNAKDALAVAESRGTPGEQVLLSQLREQVDTIQGEVDIQLRYLQAAQASQTPSGGGYSGPSGSNYPGPSGGGGGGGGGYIPRKVTVLEPSKPYGGPSGSLPADTAAGTDWVKLGLQIGAAYLLFS